MSQSDESQFDHPQHNSESLSELARELFKTEVELTLAEQELARVKNNVRCAKIQYRSLRGYRDGC